MDKGRPLQVPAQPHFHRNGTAAEPDDRDDLDGQRHQIDQAKGQQALGLARYDKMVDRIGLEQRVNDINRRTDQVQHQKGNQFPAERPHKREQLFPDLEVKGLFLVEFKFVHKNPLFSLFK